MKKKTLPQLGLVCLTSTDEVRFRTLTRTRFLAMSPELQESTLRDLYTDNARRLGKAITFCEREKIFLYRISSSLFPFSEEAPGHQILEELSGTLASIGRRAKEGGIRLVMHPDQFVVLSSERPEVIENSISILEHHARVLDLLGQPRSPWAALQLHGGKGGAGERLIAVIRNLPEAIRTRLALENDEFAYSAEAILHVCRSAGVPMVFDAHHHLCNAGLDTYDDPSITSFTEQAARTWPDPAWQLVHISNGKESRNDPRHSDFITVMPRAFLDVPWLEVEAKGKESAIAALRRAMSRKGGKLIEERAETS